MGGRTEAEWFELPAASPQMAASGGVDKAVVEDYRKREKRINKIQHEVSAQLGVLHTTHLDSFASMFLTRTTPLRTFSQYQA